MKKIIRTHKLLQLLFLLAFAGSALLGGCARYAKNVNPLYDPATTITGGRGGDIYITIPESQQTQSSRMKWVLGKVKNDDNEIVDEVLSPRSPAQIFEEAFTQELKKAGYTVIPTTKVTENEQRLIELNKTEIDLEQISSLPDIKAKCRVTVGVDVFKDGHVIKRLSYEASTSKLDIKDRDLLAKAVLRDALQSVMLKAVPELHSLLNQ